MPFCLGNPYILAAFAAVAIGVVIYETLTRQEERRNSYKRSRYRSSGSGHSSNLSIMPKDPPKPKGPSKPKSSPSSSTKPKDSPSSSTKPKISPGSLTKSENSPSPSRGSGDSPASSRGSTPSRFPEGSNFGCTESHVRRRSVNVSQPDLLRKATKEELSKAISKNDKEQSVSHTSLQNEGLSTITYRQNINENNYKDNVYEKFLNETMDEVETKSKRNVEKNISDEDSDSENNMSDKANVKLCNLDVSDKPANFSSDSNNLSLLSATEEEMYKKNVLDTLKSEKIESQTIDPSTHVQHSKKNEGIELNVKQGICSGCEESPINAAAYPCGHCYLCTDCAKTVFRIYKTCALCYNDIKEFIPLVFSQ